jgi:hypothetical protein
MKSAHMKTLIAAVGVVAFVLASAAVSSASSASSSTRPNTLPAGTKVTAALKKGTDMTFDGDINGVAVTVSCTTFSGSATIPKGSPDTMNLAKPPTISGCTVSGFSATIVTNQTNGKWSLSVTSTKPYTLTLTMPQAGALFTTKLVSGCKITAAPNAALALPGAYNGKNTDKVTNDSIPTSATGCTSSTATTTATVVFTPKPGAPPF